MEWDTCITFEVTPKNGSTEKTIRNAIRKRLHVSITMQLNQIGPCRIVEWTIVEVMIKFQNHRHGHRHRQVDRQKKRVMHITV